MASAQPVKEFNARLSYLAVLPPGLAGRNVRDVAEVYDGLPQEERAITGIFADWYMPAAESTSIAQNTACPMPVSGHLTYYLWGWIFLDVMLIVTVEQIICLSFLRV